MWEEIQKPDTGDYIIVSPSDISKIVVSQGNVIYAIDSINNKIYRSNNSGNTWNELTNNLLRAGASINFTDIAVAADKPGLVAVVTNGGKQVFASDDSGDTWQTTNLSIINGKISCIAISIKHGTPANHYVAIGTATWDGSLGGQVWTLAVGESFASWINQSIDSIANADIATIAFSPNYNIDSAILIIASTFDGSKQVTTLYKGTKNNDKFVWNDAAVGSPVIICTENALSVAKITSSLSLPSDFEITAEPKRTFFASYSRSGSDKNDVYRSHYTWHGGNAYRLYSGNERITSISYNGTVMSGNILLGFSDNITPTSVQVKYASINQAQETVTWYSATTPPSGPGNACVAWGYVNSDGITPAFCSTGLLTGPSWLYNESAFSRSIDNGDNWEQTGLINTSLKISDIAPFPDSKGLLMSAYSPNGMESIWRTAGDPVGLYWGRVISVETETNRLILRVSPEYQEDYTVYAVIVDNNTVASKDKHSTLMLTTPSRGNYWSKFYVPWPVIDLIVQNKNTAYIALDDGYVRKTVDGGINWGKPVWSGLDNINMLALTPNGHILVGGHQDSRVSYSTDGGQIFTVIDSYLDKQEGDVQVIADANYVNNQIIYAATNIPNKGIWRWVIGSSTQWTQVDESISNQDKVQKFSGLATGPEGTLYVLRAEISDNTLLTGGMNRTLNPSDPNEYAVLWDEVNHTIPDETEFNPLLNFANSLPHLKISGNKYKNDLWAVDLHNNQCRIYMFTDDICKTGPITKGQTMVSCNPATGRSRDIDLSWEQPSSGQCNEIQVASDPTFSLRLTALEPIENPNALPVEEDGIAAFILPGDQLECGSFFYWRVRVRSALTGENITSPWSNPVRFAIQPGYQVTTIEHGIKLLSPEKGSCCPCAAKQPFSWSPYLETSVYRFQLSEDPEMKKLMVDTIVQGTTAYLYPESLPYGRNYYWRVKAIQPISSDWSEIFDFNTQAPSSSFSPTILPRSTPAWVWTLIGMCLGLCSGILVLILRRYYI